MKVVVMSATLDAGKFQDYFKNAPLISWVPTNQKKTRSSWSQVRYSWLSFCDKPFLTPPFQSSRPCAPCRDLLHPGARKRLPRGCCEDYCSNPFFWTRWWGGWRGTQKAELHVLLPCGPKDRWIIDIYLFEDLSRYSLFFGTVGSTSYPANKCESISLISPHYNWNIF